MWTSAFIRRHICRLPKGNPFTTRDMLRYGSRPAVDQTLYRMVKSGEILRLARGVFIVESPDAPLPSVLEVAMVKAQSFAKRIVSHGADIAKALGLAQSGNLEPTFSIDGRSSSFRYGSEVIHFKGTSPRKLLDEGRTGRVIRALWHIGRERCNEYVVMVATASLGFSDRLELRDLSRLMPAWMTSYFSCAHLESSWELS